MISNILRCARCGEYNITIDINSNITICNDCKCTDKIKKIDIEDYRQNNIEKEEETMELFKKLNYKIYKNRL